MALTPAGLRTIDNAFAAQMRNEARLVEPLTRTQHDQLEKLLKTWLAAYED